MFPSLSPSNCTSTSRGWWVKNCSRHQKAWFPSWAWCLSSFRKWSQKKFLLSADSRPINVSTDKCVDRYSLKPSILDWYLTDTWPIHDRYLTDTWPILDRHLTDTWPILDRHLTDTWPTLDWYSTDSRLILNRYMTDTWPMHDRYFTGTSPILDRHFTDTWPTLHRYFTDTWPIIHCPRGEG